ncbi:MAG: hypothetical protein ABSD70_00620 [Terracidiphilus sp.]|jgi:hypothetical protein
MWEQVENALHASFVRVLTEIATLLPAVLSLLVAVAVCGLLGLFFAWIFRRLLVAFRFDERTKASRTAALLQWWSPGQSFSLALSRVVFWAGILLGLVLGIASFDAAYSPATHFAVALYPYLTRLVSAILILLAGTIVSRYLARTVLIGAVNMNLQYARLLSQGVKWLVMVLTVAMALDHLGIGGTVVELAFGILFGGIVLALSLAIGLGSKEMVSRSLEPESHHANESANTQTVRHF